VVLSTGQEFSEDLLPLQIRLFAQQVRGDPPGESIQALAGKLADRAVKQAQPPGGDVYNNVMDEVQRCLIREAISHSGGVKTQAADFLGINRNTLNNKFKKLRLDE